MASKKKKLATKKSVKKSVKKNVVKKITKKVTAKKTAPKKATKKSAVKPVQKTKKAMVPLKATKPVKFVDYTKAITPLADRLVVRVVETEKVTAGGIIIPDNVSTVAGHLKGQVLAVGTGARNKKGQVRPLDVKLGDFVLFAEYSGIKVEFNSEEVQIVNESDVMGIVQK